MRRKIWLGHCRSFGRVERPNLPEEDHVYSLYAVRLRGKEKLREYIHTYESLDEAKHVANCCTLGTAHYAYIKDTVGGTVFFIRNPEYETFPLDQVAPGPISSRAGKDED